MILILEREDFVEIAEQIIKRIKSKHLKAPFKDAFSANVNGVALSVIYNGSSPTTIEVSDIGGNFVVDYSNYEIENIVNNYFMED